MQPGRRTLSISADERVGGQNFVLPGAAQNSLRGIEGSKGGSRKSGKRTRSDCNNDRFGEAGLGEFQDGRYQVQPLGLVFDYLRVDRLHAVGRIEPVPEQRDHGLRPRLPA